MCNDNVEPRLFLSYSYDAAYETHLCVDLRSLILSVKVRGIVMFVWNLLHIYAIIYILHVSLCVV